MALETPISRFTRPTAERAAPPPAAPRWAGDDAVPRGLAVASAVTLRLLIVFGGVALLALVAQRMLLVVLPLILALLLTTLLAPLARWLECHGFRPAPAAVVAVLLAVLVFAGLWALIIPAAVGQGDELGARVQEGAGQVADVLKPVGIDSSDLDRAVAQASATARHQALPAAMLAAQWAGAIVLIVVLTFFFVKDGRRIWGWVVELFHESRQPALDDVGARVWDALATYVRGVFLVATIDAVFIGAGLLVVGVPMALPLIVLTFLAAFFPIIGATVAGAAAVLVALVSNGVAGAMIILAVILLVQQLEGNVFYPVVVGRRMQLHPVAILLALTAGGVLAGVAGAFLAVPVAAITSAVLDYVRRRREGRQQDAVLSPS
jgi:predicted PurR-regulated permease PerM